MPVPGSEPCAVYVFHRTAMSDLELRIRGEYREMPGLRLRAEQAMRLWSLDRATCERVLDNLVRGGFLHRDDNGRYARVHGGY